MRALALATCATMAGCATLGPMPGRTGVSPVPAEHPEVAAQLGFMPGYYLSASASASPKGAAIPQLLAALDPGHVAPGLLLGGRAFGESGDTALEPILGYRRALDFDGRFSVAALLYGARMRTTQAHATYAATRAGLEGAADVRLTDRDQAIEAHAFGSLSITNVTADGTYCVDAATETHAVDCPDPYPEPPPPQATAALTGVYPALTLGVAADLLNLQRSVLHGVRVELMVGAGAMPRVEDGVQQRATGYLTLGFSLTLSVGGR